MTKIKDKKSYYEIHEQKNELRQTLRYMRSKMTNLNQLYRGCGDIVFLASGSSYWMSLSAHKTMHVLTGRKTIAIKAGDVVLCSDEYEGLFESPLIICPSRSGYTSEVLLALEILRRKYSDLKVLSIVEFDESPLESTSDLCLKINWAKEESVCQTKSFSCLYLTSVLLASIFASKNELFYESERYLAEADILYQTHEEEIKKLIECNNFQEIISLGCGRQYGVCIEGAYIITEMAQFSTNYYQLLEYRHGPIVTVENGSFIFVLSADNIDEYEESIIFDAQKYGAKVIVISGAEKKYGDLSLHMGGHWSKEIIALHYAFIMQSFAYYLAEKLGRNPDNPGQLVQYIDLISMEDKGRI